MEGTVNKLKSHWNPYKYCTKNLSFFSSKIFFNWLCEYCFLYWCSWLLGVTRIYKPSHIQSLIQRSMYVSNCALGSIKTSCLILVLHHLRTWGSLLVLHPLMSFGILWWKGLCLSSGIEIDLGLEFTLLISNWSWDWLC